MMISCRVAASLVLLACFCQGTPLNDYVNAPDPTYNYTITTTIKGLDYTFHNLFLTSQTWLTSKDSSQPVWTHWLQVCIPNKPKSTDVGVIYIDGGHSPNTPANPPKEGDTLTEMVCATSNVIMAHLSAIPNEPITFPGDPTHKSRSEDAIIAYTWMHFINDTSEPNWLLRLPMTKAVVKAMDAMQDFTSKLGSHVTPLERFIVGGASKRGWTTWTTGAVDDRVLAIFPIVAPVGNLVPQINEMWESYGAWSFALSDYLDMHLMDYLNDPVFEEMLTIIDPLAYKDALKMPKYVIVDVADEFFMPDGINWMWDQLEGPKILRTVANAEHSLTGHQLDVAAGVQAWVLSFVDRKPLPNVTWTFSADGTQIKLQIHNLDVLRPNKVVMFHAYNSKARDFRWITCMDFKDPKCIHPILWAEETLVDQGNGLYIAENYPPQVGYLGFFIQLEYNIGGASIADPFKVSSGVSIIPKQLPYPPCGAPCARPPPNQH